MGETMKNTANTTFERVRGRFLASASILSLVASAAGSTAAFSATATSPVTLEFGWQVENGRYSGDQPGLPLGPEASQSGLTAPLVEQLSPFHSNSLEGKATYRPDDSDWAFLASVRYGRSQRAGNISQALAPIPTTSFATYKFTYPYFPSSNKLRVKGVPVTRQQLNADYSSEESRLLIDFEVGKDVGIGLFGRNSTSFLAAGVRFAHFKMTRQTNNLQKTEGIHFQTSQFRTYTWPGYGTRRRELWDTLSANGSVAQNFTGLGPSVQWEASAELWHDPRGGGVSLDWGANAAILFGKQKKRAQHQSSTADQCFGSHCPVAGAPLMSTGRSLTTRNITVPNIGGFAGVSLNYTNVEFGFGYRADLFMNAIDVGFDTRKSSNLLLHGPYAHMSIGLP
jgi:hypothetical protein